MQTAEDSGAGSCGSGEVNSEILRVGVASEFDDSGVFFDGIRGRDSGRDGEEVLDFRASFFIGR